MRRTRRTIVVTPNPALDRTVETDAQQASRVTRTRLVAQQAGGKGLNVVRVLDQLGVPDTVAIAPLGGLEGDQFESLARADGVDLHAVRVQAPTRICLTCRSASGEVLELNEAGGGLTSQEWETLGELIATITRAGDTVVISGSMPAGIDSGALSTLIRRLRALEAAIVVDTSGPMLTNAVDNAVDLVVPNVDEARQALGMPRATSIELATTFAERGVPALVTDGARGAVLAQADGQVHVSTPPQVTVVSTVGAGDALLAGWLAGQHRGMPSPRSLRLATVVGAAACTSLTAGHVDPRLVDRLLESAPPVETT